MSTPNPLASGAGATQVLTVLQNLVQALNNLTQTMLNIAGLINFGPVSSATVVKTSAGRVCEIAVISAGTTVGYIYDSASLGTTTAAMIPLPNLVGVYKVTFPTSFGILVIPGVGQTVSGSYS